jgi:catechol 2,3-dioxygenase-like lactoylglutathione lyase family enzyme
MVKSRSRYWSIRSYDGFVLALLPVLAGTATWCGKTARSDQELFDQMTRLYLRWVANQSWLMFGFPVQLSVGIGVVMSSVQIEQKSYEMPPREGMSIAHFLTVADIERSARYYEKVFGARILSLGDGNAPGYLQLANIWMILNVGGGPTPDKPTVTLSVPDPNHINSFMNFRVADIQACYELWKSRGAEFITEPIPKYGETRCYIRDPDGYVIEVGQSTDLAYG